MSQSKQHFFIVSSVRIAFLDKKKSYWLKISTYYENRTLHQMIPDRIKQAQ